MATKVEAQVRVLEGSQRVFRSYLLTIYPQVASISEYNSIYLGKNKTVDTRRIATASFTAILFLLQFSGSEAKVFSEQEKSQPSISLPLEGKLTQPDFRTPPTPEQLWKEYPKLARYMRIPGSVKVTCDVEANTTVDNCHVDSETPLSLGFGAAAIALAHEFQLKPGTFDGAPVKAKFTRTIRFRIEETPAVVNASPLEFPSSVTVKKVELARRLISLENLNAAMSQSQEAFLANINQELSWSGRPAETEAAMDAYRQGVQDALVVLLEKKAQRVAAVMSDEQLQASLAFLSSSAGQAWLSEFLAPDPVTNAEFQTRAPEAARTRFCAKVKCLESGA